MSRKGEQVGEINEHWQQTRGCSPLSGHNLLGPFCCCSSLTPIDQNANSENIIFICFVFFKVENRTIGFVQRVEKCKCILCRCEFNCRMIKIVVMTCNSDLNVSSVENV